MNLKDLKLTQEEFEMFRMILLDRSFYYDNKVVESKMKMFTASDEAIAETYQNEIDFYFKYKDLVLKIYNYLKK